MSKLTCLSGFNARRRSSGSGSGTIGIDSILGSEAGIGNDRFCALRVTMPENGTITKLTAYLNDNTAGGFSCKGMVFSHDGPGEGDAPNYPEDLLTSGSAVAIPDSFGWVDLPVTSEYVADATPIWIAFVCNGSIRFKYQLSAWADNAFNYNAENSYSTPTDANDSGNRYDNGGLSIYATYTI